MKDRRLASVRIDPAIFAQLFQVGEQRGYRVVTGLPEGSELVDARFDTERGQVILWFRHESFAPLVFGQSAPEIYVSVEALDA